MDLREATHFNTVEESEHWWIRTRFRYLEQAVSQLPGELEILEMGFGTGQNVTFLKSHPHLCERITSIAAYDPHFDSGKGHRSPVGVDIVESEERLGGRKFDLVFAMDVLEHIEDDKAAIVRWTSLLKPNGKLFMTVPAFQSLWSYHDVNLGHFRRYTKNQLVALVQEQGLRCTRANYAFGFAFFPIYFIRTFFGVGKKKSKLDPGLRVRPGNFIFNALGFIEYLFGGNPFFGTSVVATFEKKI